MRWNVMLLTITAALPLVACQSPGEVTAAPCRTAYPPGSAAYAECRQREDQRRIMAPETDADQRSREEYHAGF
jgi:hypothetical protein